MNLPRTPSFRLDGRRALVTGGGRGLGAAAAVALAQAGATVYPAARSMDEIAALVEAIRSEGGKAEALKLDVTDIPTMHARLQAIDPFDILVNNAGTNRPKPMLEVTLDDYDAVEGLNLKAAYFVAQAVVSGMVSAKRSGCVINISSQMGHVGATELTRMPFGANSTAIALVRPSTACLVAQ